MRQQPGFNSRELPTCHESTLLAQVNRATRNNVFGLLLPQGVIPSMSGPVLGTNNFGTAWGSAIGVLVTWEPFDFGLRQASVAAATAARTQSEASSQEDPVRRLRGGCGRLRNFGRGAGDRPSGSSRRRSSRSDFADDQRAGERAVATWRGRVPSGSRACGCANA